MSEPMIRIVLEVPASMTVKQLVTAFAMLGLRVIFRSEQEENK